MLMRDIFCIYDSNSGRLSILKPIISHVELYNGEQ